MKQTVNLSDFRDAFRARDRAEQFSYAGLDRKSTRLNSSH
jgi:hypothetical protein